jgi:hypothetical protein
MSPWLTQNDEKFLVGRASVPAMDGRPGTAAHQFHIQGSYPELVGKELGTESFVLQRPLKTMKIVNRGPRRFGSRRL